MSSPFQIAPKLLSWNRFHQTVTIEPWGKDGVRIRATMLSEFLDIPGALLPLLEDPSEAEIVATSTPEMASLTNGKVKVEIGENGQIRIFHNQTGKLLLSEETPHFTHYPARWFRPRVGSDTYHLQVSFLPQPGEKFFGLGQHQHGMLNQRGCVIDLLQRNTEVSIPFLLSDLGYGLLWNNPAIGRVELSENGTRWIAESTSQMDYYFVVGDSPAEIIEKYTAAVGRAPLLPEFAAGFWQCKLRYKTQAELLNVAREYKQRGLPISVIVVDFFHWTMLGDWQFDPVDWPDPAAMVRELDSLGVKLMVSVWPTVNRASRNYDEMLERGLLVRSDRGNPVHMAHLPDTFPPKAPVLLTYYDPMHPEGRKFIWETIRDNYYRYGIKVFWLDACEPEYQPIDHDAIRYHLGSGLEVGQAYPLFHQQGFWEGMKSEGEEEIINLCRSAWAGSQRYGAAVWSGDIPSTFESLRAQIPAGLNIGVSGIPWWTTDIGGFHSGDPRTTYFRELIVRWFQYGVFCPLFRLHGVREPFVNEGAYGTGAANEVWSFGEPAFAIIKQLMFIREKLRPYIMAQMQIASTTGLPPMRPIFIDFPAEPNSWEIADQFMLGPDLLVAPILFEGEISRKVFLPAGANWIDAWSGQSFSGGQQIEVQAPLERVPVFWRSGSSEMFLFAS